MAEKLCRFFYNVNIAPMYRNRIVPCTLTLTFQVFKGKTEIPKSKC